MSNKENQPEFKQLQAVLAQPLEQWPASTKRYTQGFPSASLNRSDLMFPSQSDNLEERERFAVKLRVSKRKEILSAKRLKLTKTRQEAYQSMGMREARAALVRQSAPLSSQQERLFEGQYIVSETQDVLNTIHEHFISAANNKHSIDSNLLDRLCQLKRCLCQEAKVQDCIMETSIEQLVHFSDTCYLALQSAITA